MRHPLSGFRPLFSARPLAGAKATRRNRYPGTKPRTGWIEALEGRIAPSTLVMLTGGAVKVYGDQGGAGEQETLELSATARGVTVSDPLHDVLAGPGALA